MVMKELWAEMQDVEQIEQTDEYEMYVNHALDEAASLVANDKSLMTEFMKKVFKYKEN